MYIFLVDFLTFWLVVGVLGFGVGWLEGLIGRGDGCRSNVSISV